ncbi:MAG: hypothetical protein PHO56_01490, partial [Patescibacteria group bacterium]|nr:hypothetical protein [Patescibacteria group bacterium]
AGSWTSYAANTLTASTSQITFTNTGTITSGGKSFYNVIINAPTKTVTLGDALTTNSGGSLTLTAGTLNTNAKVVSIGGNVTLASAGTFTTTGSKFVFTGTPTITANGKSFPSSAFYNGATFSDNVTFARATTTPGKTYSFGKTFTLTSYTAGDWNGTAGNLVTLQSTSTGNHWNFANPAGMTVNYVAVKDSYATNDINAVSPTNVNNGGNNVHWIFAPTTPNPLTRIASTTTAIKLGYPAPVVELSFSQYKIYYRLGSTTPIHETDSLWGSSSDANLGYINFNGKSSTTITGLAPATVYSFSLWAYDILGGKSSSTLIWDRTDRNPTIAINSAAERIDATGKVDFSFTANDPDSDDQVMARAEYFADALCHTSANQATLDETDANTTATHGDPKVQNKNTYQIGTSTGYILTSSGANTVNTVWNSQTDLPTGDGTYCLKLTLNDNRGGTAIATTSLIIDNVAPAGFGPLTLSKKNDNSITVNFNSAATETNFTQYKIYYKAGAAGVKTTNTLFGSSSDSALGSKTYLGHATTAISRLNSGTAYVFNLFAYDSYGHVASSSAEFSTNTKSYPAAPSSLNQYKSDGTTAIVNGGWTNQNEVKLFATSTDADSDAITLYYQLATTSGTYLTATTTPIGACSSGTVWASCPSRVWQTPASVKKADIAALPDDNYKWQALACDADGCSRSWKNFNDSIPNFTTIINAPYFTADPSDNGSATNTPTAYGQNVTFSATAADTQNDQYYLAICQTNAIVAGDGGAPTCTGGSWCVSGRASSTQPASCLASTAHLSSESYDWYGFVCDYHFGAGVARCSVVSQGSAGSPNASPFRVNHQPVFTTITTLNDNQDPGALFNIQATAADSDANSSLNYFVCATSSATASGCAGGASNTLCSAVATTTANPICHYQNSIPTPAGAYTYYAFVFDNFSLQATTSPLSGSYHINNTAPVLGALSINGNADITLNIKGAADKQVQLLDTSVTDLNGCQTLVSATAAVYRTSLGYNCVADDNNCYQITTANCALSNCSGPADSIATYTCSTSLKFFAEPTDNTTNNPWSADTWTGRLQVYDGVSYSATTSPTVEVNTNSALDVPEKNINFGTLATGLNTGTTNQSVTVINYGNSPLNSDVAGTNMLGSIGGAIASTYIHWDLTQNFLYSTGNTLKNGGEVVSLDLAKPTSTADIYNLIYWGIGVPATSTITVFHGTSTFAAVLNSLGW